MAGPGARQSGRCFTTLATSAWVLMYHSLLHSTTGTAVSQCGVVRNQGPSAHIIGGVPATENQFPWMAMLLVNDVFLCGGTIIDPMHVITAAHCVDKLSRVSAHRNTSVGVVQYLNTQSVQIVAGRYSYFHVYPMEPGEQRVNVHAGIYHDRYRLDLGTDSNDIAVLQLERPLSFNTRVSALCLPTAPSAIPPRCTLAGWGDIRGAQSGAKPSQLMTVTMSAYNRSACVALESSMSAWNMDSYSVNLDIDMAEHIMCLANSTYGGQETCFGDSGGPVFCLESEGMHYELVGVVSWGYGYCPALRAFPSIQTYVPAYLSWIQQTIDNLASPCAFLPCSRLYECHERGNSYQCLCRSALSGPYCTHCGQNLTGSHGNLTSPNYPLEYYTSLDCHWTIATASGMFVELTFLDMDTEGHFACSYDYVEVRENNARGRILAKLCGSTVPDPIVSSSSLYVLFHSDSSTEFRGFSASYRMTVTVSPCARKPCSGFSTCHEQGNTYECVCNSGYNGVRCDKCGQNLTASQGTFTSVNYPLNYPNSLDCVWTIVVASEQTVELTFLDMNLGQNLREPSPCYYDYVEVRESGWLGRRLAKLCRSTRPAPIVSETSIDIHFQTALTNPISVYRGFKASYRIYGCPAFTFGDTCTQSCSCVKAHSLSCDARSGLCHCKVGWHGANCVSEVNECGDSPCVIDTINIPVIFTFDEDVVSEHILTSSTDQTRMQIQLSTSLVNKARGILDVKVNSISGGSTMIVTTDVLVAKAKGLEATSTLIADLTDFGVYIDGTYRRSRVQIAGLQLTHSTRPCDVVDALGLCSSPTELQCDSSSGQPVCRSADHSDHSEFASWKIGVIVGVISFVVIVSLTVIACSVFKRKATDQRAASGSRDNLSVISSGRLQTQAGVSSTRPANQPCRASGNLQVSTKQQPINIRCYILKGYTTGDLTAA